MRILLFLISAAATASAAGSKNGPRRSLLSTRALRQDRRRLYGEHSGPNCPPWDHQYACPSNCRNCYIQKYFPSDTRYYYCKTTFNGAAACLGECNPGSLVNTGIHKGAFWAWETDEYYTTCASDCTQYIGTCQTCQNGYFVAQSGSQCANCIAGYFCPDGLSQERCPVGYYSTGNAESCTICPLGTTDVDRTSCQICPAGTYGNDARTSCEPCPIGKQCSNGLQSDCPSGYYSEGGAEQCTICPAGHACRNGIKTECGVGQFASREQQEECTSCLASTCSVGQYISGCGGSFAGTCLGCTSSCPVGQYLINECVDGQELQDASCTDCAECPADKYMAGCSGSQVGACLDCTHTLANCGNDDGFYLESACSPGSTSMNSACTLCSKCDVGFYMNGCRGDSAGTCQPCTVTCDSATQRTVGTCDGTTIEDQRCEDLGPGECLSGFYFEGSCKSCQHTSCGDNEYLVGECDGLGNEDNSECMPCGSCAAGEYRAGCSGTSEGVCVSCSGTCSLGQHIAAACDGSAFEAPACENCASCGAGQVLQDCDPDGASPGSCLDCAVGTFAAYTDASLKIGACLSCKNCNAGSYLSGCTPDGGSEGTCVECDVRDASSCPADEYIVNPCSGSGTENSASCESCNPDMCAEDEYLQGCGGTSAGVCVKMTTCDGISFTEEVAPTPVSDRKCKPCSRCYDKEFVTRTCSPTEDVVCQGAQQCVSGVTYLSTDYVSGSSTRLGSDRVCNQVTPCNLYSESNPGGTQYIVNKPTVLADFTCSALNTLSEDELKVNYYEMKVDADLCEQIWSEVSVGARPDGYNEWPCVHKTAVRTICEYPEYTMDPGNSTSDAVCAPTATCNSTGEFVFEEATSVTNRICMSCELYANPPTNGTNGTIPINGTNTTEPPIVMPDIDVVEPDFDFVVDNMTNYTKRLDEIEARYKAACLGIYEGDGKGMCEKAGEALGDIGCAGVGGLIGGLAAVLAIGGGGVYAKKRRDHAKQTKKLEDEVDNMQDNLEIEMNINPILLSQSSNKLTEERERLRQAQEAHERDLKAMANMRSELAQLKKQKQTSEPAGEMRGDTARKAQKKKKEFAGTRPTGLSMS